MFFVFHFNYSRYSHLANRLEWNILHQLLQKAALDLQTAAALRCRRSCRLRISVGWNRDKSAGFDKIRVWAVAYRRSDLDFKRWNLFSLRASKNRPFLMSIFIGGLSKPEAFGIARFVDVRVPSPLKWQNQSCPNLQDMLVALYLMFGVKKIMKNFTHKEVLFLI